MKEREEKKKVLDPTTERMFFFLRRHCKVYVIESVRKSDCFDMRGFLLLTKGRKQSAGLWALLGYDMLCAPLFVIWME
jgi:hypothetical protein